jgi:hypothetical protein
MEYKRRRVSSAIDDDIELGKNTDNITVIEKNSNINTLSVFEYYKVIFREFIKLMCCCRYNNCENDQMRSV